MSKTIVCIAGIPGSGKTTLANELLPEYPNAIHLDGNKFRETTGRNSFKEACREENHLMALRSILATGQMGIMSFLFPFKELRAKVVKIAHNKGYKVLFVHAFVSLEEARRRTQCSTKREDTYGGVGAVGAVTGTTTRGSARFEDLSVEEGFDAFLRLDTENLSIPEMVDQIREKLKFNAPEAMFVPLIVPQRSGSNMLMQMLGMHPALVAPFPPVLVKDFEDLEVPLDEEDLLQLMVETANKGPRSPNLSIDDVRRECLEFTPTGIQEAMYRAMAHREQPGASHILCKDPANYMRMERYMEANPSLKTILLTRHPLAVANSSKGTPRSAGSPCLEAKKWVEIHQASQKVMEKYPERVLLVRYEDLVSNKQEQLERICNFFNIPFEAKMLESHNSQTAKKAAEKNPTLWGGLAEPTYTHRTEAWRKSLSLEEQLIIWATAGSVAQKYGYDYQPEFENAELMFADGWAPVQEDEPRKAQKEFLSQKILPFMGAKKKEQAQPAISTIHEYQQDLKKAA